MPVSGSDVGAIGVQGQAVARDTVDALARTIGFDARRQPNLPHSATGVWALSFDSMSTDSAAPMSDRKVHVDQQTSHIPADVKYADHSLAGKAMAVCIALRMDTMGLWSVLANTLICVSVQLSCGGSVSRMAHNGWYHYLCRVICSFGRVPCWLA